MNAVIEKLIPLADAHQECDEYVARKPRWDIHGGACGIGCTCHDAIGLGILPEGCDYDHAALASATGTDERVWRLLDAIFEGLPAADRRAWTPRCLRAISACDDTHAAVWRFLFWLLGPDSPSAKGNLHPSVASEVALVRGLCGRAAAGDMPTRDEWSAAGSAVAIAWSAAAIAWSAAVVAWLATAVNSAAMNSAESAEWSAWQKIADRLVYELQQSGGSV